MAFCSGCGAQVADGAAFCPACGRGMGQATSVPANAGGLADNVAGALAYVTIIPAIIFLVIEPFNRSRFVRFHAFQSIFFALTWAALWIVLNIVVHIPIFGWLTVLLWPIVGLAGFIIWLVLILKAFQNQMF